MKALLIPEYSPTGGTGTFFFRLLDVHQENNIKTGIIITEAQVDDKVLSVCREKGYQVFTVPNRKKVFFEAYASLVYDIYYYYKIVKNFLPDLIVVSNGTPGINLGVFLLRFPVLFIMHTIPMKTSWKTIGMKFITHFLSSRKKSFVTVSQYASKKIHVNMNVLEKNIDVVYNSYKPVNITSNPGRSPIVLTIGHVVDYKNPEIWFEVAKKVISYDNSIKFIWLGNGKMLERMRTAVIETNLEENIFFNGYESDVNPFYQKALIYFQPSRTENHSIGIISAMSFGLPCIVSDTGGNSESIINGKTGYVCSLDDIDGFTKGIISCLKNPKLLEQLGEAGRERTLNLFSEDLQENKILQLYNEKIQPGSTKRMKHNPRR